MKEDLMRDEDLKKKKDKKKDKKDKKKSSKKDDDTLDAVKRIKKDASEKKKKKDKENEGREIRCKEFVLVLFSLLLPPSVSLNVTNTSATTATTSR